MKGVKETVWAIRQSRAKERIGFDRRSPWWGEHRSRYYFAASEVRGKSVLDIACGTGLGMQVLDDAGADVVVGIDVFLPGILDALSIVPGSIGAVGDGTRLPLQDGIVDVVTSFETIEHIDRDRAFVSELRRVLAPGGTLYLSTPNRAFTKKLPGPPNPFHVREYEPDELSSLLEGFFDQVDVLGQRTHPRYPISPYWQLPEHLPRDPRGRMQVLSWKLRRRLPFRVKDGLSRLIHNLSFYPGEYDFEFTDSAIDEAHALVAVCR